MIYIFLGDNPLIQKMSPPLSPSMSGDTINERKSLKKKKRKRSPSTEDQNDNTQDFSKAPKRRKRCSSEESEAGRNLFKTQASRKDPLSSP